MISGGHVGTHPLTEGQTITVGRAEENDVRIDSSSVSREHARIYVDRVMNLEDLGSANGTKIGDATIPPNERVPFHVGVPISFGDAVATVQMVPEGVAPEAIGGDEASNGGGGAATIVDPSMVALYETIERVGGSELDVLILGETGVGKELVAQELHRRSPRSAAPMISVNCAALSETLLESELFGHVKGAFTGADNDKDGILEAANTGTVFLDEVGELPLGIQAKLLRAIDVREIQPVGAVRTKTIDVRFVSATNRDLDEEVKVGNFRKDLLHRLDGMSIHVPPLRRRPADIIPLAERFITQAKRPGGTTAELELSDAAAALLRRYQWPGNVRELKKVIERAAVLSRNDMIDAVDLPVEKMSAAIATSAELEARGGPSDDGTDRWTAEETDVRKRILDALADFNGNQTRAAEKLGISRRTFTNWLDRYDIPRPRKQTRDA